MTKEYFDMNGRQIQAGDVLTDGDKYFEKVHACALDEDSETNDDLGINATNWNSLAATKQYYYPLSDIDLSDLYVVAEKEDDTK